MTLALVDPVSSTLNNRLATLAGVIREAHDDVCRAHQYSAERAVDAGRALFEAKNSPDIPRGQWERWVEREAGVPYSKAQRYIQLYVAVSNQSLLVEDIADAGQKGALRAAAEAEKERETELRKAEVAARALATPQATERYKLIHAPVTALLDEPANSIDIIVTDPPYPEEFLPVFGDLVRGAAHVLRPGGLLLCMSGQTHLLRVAIEMSTAMADTALHYLWELSYLTPGGQATQVFPCRVNTFWKPVLIFCQGEYAGNWYGDVVRSDVNDNDKEHHHWGQSVSGMADLMRRFVLPGHTVCDPFLGGGTTAVVAMDLGANFIGFDVDPEALLATRARLSDG